MVGFRNRPRPELIVCLILTVITIAAYWQVSGYDFVGFDDNTQIVANSYLHKGITIKTIAWAFGFESSTYWHPITWLSHMLGFQLFGFRPGMHHWINLLFHISNTLLLFLILKRMTGAFWQSAFVAGLFAIHPLNVESVAWVAARKNVLSTFFWMLTMLAYVGYTERPGAFRYLLVFMALALGLMAKPMLVTLPFVLLLMDYWPLGRLRFKQPSGNNNSATGEPVYSAYQPLSGFCLVIEKIPLLVLSAISVYLSSLSIQHLDISVPTAAVPIKLRIANAFVSYVSYIKKMVWPSKLAALYLYPEAIPLWQAAGACLLLGGVSFIVLRNVKLKPYLTVGWLWYLGTLIPVIGLVQGGLWPAMADRFIYVPLIGLFVMIAWGIPDLTGQWRRARPLLGISAAAVLGVLTMVTWLQTGYWKSSLDLFGRAVNVTARNWLAHNNLGTAKYNQGKIDEAIEHYKTALSVKPDYVTAHYNLGNAYLNQGRMDEAVSHFRDALKIKPEHAYTHYSYGNLLLKQGRFKKALFHFFEAIKTNPDYAEAYNQIGVILARQKKYEGAAVFISKAIQIEPDNLVAHKNLEAITRMTTSR